MNKPWVFVATAVSGLLIIGLLVKRFAGSDAPEPTVVQEQLASVAQRGSGARSGWAAQPGGATGSDTGTAGAAGAVGSGRAAARSGRHAEGAVGAEGGHGAAEAIYGNRRHSDVVSGAGAGSGAAEGSIDVSSVVKNPPSFDGPRQLRREGTMHGGLATTEQVAVPPAAQKPQQDTADDNGLVLSLPLENSTTPDKGGVDPVVQEGIAFDSQGTKFSADSQFVIPNAGNINPQAGTISFWIQPDWQGSDQTDASLVQLREQNTFENRMQITKNGEFLRFIFADNTGMESGAGYQINNWQPGDQHLVTATWGDALTTLYVDGQKVGQQPYSGQLEVKPGTPLYIGSDYPGQQPGAQATLSQFQVYNRPLTGDEVANLLTTRK